MKSLGLLFTCSEGIRKNFRKNKCVRNWFYEDLWFLYYNIALGSKSKWRKGREFFCCWFFESAFSINFWFLSKQIRILIPFEASGYLHFYICIQVPLFCNLIYRCNDSLNLKLMFQKDSMDNLSKQTILSSHIRQYKSFKNRIVSNHFHNKNNEKLGW